MRLLALALLGLLAAPASAGSFSTAARGTTAAEFLELGAGARALSMGEAYGAVADDATALYWNPGALTALRGRSATFMHEAYLGSSYFDYLACGQKLGARGAVAGSVQYFSAGGITQTNAAGADVGSFTQYDLAVTAGYAHTLTSSGAPWLDGASIGASGKFIQSHVLKSAQTAALDLGVLSPAYMGGKLRLGASALNMGGTLRFDQANENLPFALRLASSYRLSAPLLASLDLVLPRNDRPYVAVGGEYKLVSTGPWAFAGRAGFNSQTIGSIDGFTGVSFGIGVGYRGQKLDYGFLPLGSVGQAHRVSLTVEF